MPPLKYRLTYTELYHKSVTFVYLYKEINNYLIDLFQVYSVIVKLLGNRVNS